MYQLPMINVIVTYYEHVLNKNALKAPESFCVYGRFLIFIIWETETKKNYKYPIIPLK